MTALILQRCRGLLTVQDMGRPGHTAQGLSRGGAMDRIALLEAAALLGSDQPLASIEMAGAGGVFEVVSPMRIALTGAPMIATLDDQPLRWSASHLIKPGQSLSISFIQNGSYGYLTPAGGIDSADWLGSRSAHLQIGVFARLSPGRIPVGPDRAPEAEPMALEVDNRFGGGTVRVMEGPQTDLFDQAVRDEFFETEFTRSRIANRQGVRFDAEARFTTKLAAGLASDLIGPGDIQMTGDGVPYVLMAECQTMGGYPRLGTVFPGDLPAVAQAPHNAKLKFVRLSLEEAENIWQAEDQQIKALKGRCHALVPDTHPNPGQPSLQHISGTGPDRK